MMTDAIDIGNRKQLFIDNKWFFTQRGMTLTVNPPIKKELVLAPEMPWESRAIQGGSSTISEHDGQAYMGLGMIRKGNEIWQYYGGTSYFHGSYEPDKHKYEGGLCRLVQRLDGFISADADYTGAEFTTPMITFTGTRLKLNVDCSAMGEVWVEIRDEKNHVIPGYSLADSIDVDRNQIAAPVRWQERDNVAELKGRSVRLHFKLRACKLYAFQFDNLKLETPPLAGQA